ncbi:hypothetical protein KJ762_16040 [bacterium]|nr:hypothetical protein [bacterium]MBU1063988.1 hypothetical protein [bacterium]MBU1635995.1 hypothetical protein [bacterium]MBU1874740.1 hypothetical protein [bacterium]
MKKITFSVLAIILVAIILIVSCEFKEATNVENERARNRLQVNAAVFRMGYDEKVQTFALRWPGSIVHEGLAKTTEDDENLLLLDYQDCYQEMAIDTNGYFHYEKSHNEGNAEISMPEDMWEDVKDDVPYNPDIDKAAEQYRFSNGIMEAVATNGDIVYSIPYDPEEYRINLDSLSAVTDTMSGDNDGGTGNKFLTSLRADNVNFKMVGDASVVIESDMPDDPVCGRMKQLYDIEQGLPVRTAFYRKDGRFDSVYLSAYENIDGVPVETQTICYDFGEVNGKWEATTVTYIIKENVWVEKNLPKK